MAVVANVAINVDAANAIQQLNRVKQASDGVNKGLDTASVGAKGFGAALQAALGPLLTITTAIAALQKGLDTAFQRGAAEQQLKNITSSTEEYRAALALAADSSQKFGLTQTESTKALADVYSRLKGVGFGLKETGEIYQGFNVIAKQSGLAGEEVAGAFFQLSQALGKGKLNGDEFVIVAERMPQLLDAIATTTGRSRGELTQMAAQGKITSQVLYDALSGAAAASGDLNGKLNEQQKAFNNLRQVTDQLLGKIGQVFGPLVVAGAQALADAGQMLSNWWGYVGTVIFPKVQAALRPIVESLRAAFVDINFDQVRVFLQNILIKGFEIAVGVIGKLSSVLAFVIDRFKQLSQNPVFQFIAEQVGRLANHLGLTTDKVTEFKNEQDKVTQAARQSLDKYSSLPAPINDAKEAAKQLKEEQKAVTSAIQEAAAAADQSGKVQAAVAAQRSQIEAAYLNTQKEINSVLLSQVERQLQGAKTQEQRIAAAKRIYTLTVKQAKIEYDINIAAIRAEVDKAKLAVQITAQKVKQVEAAVFLARAEGKVNEEHYKALDAIKDALNLAEIQAGTAAEIAYQQERGAKAILNGKIQAAEAAYQSNLIAKNTNQAANAASQFAGNMMVGAAAAQQAAATVGSLERMAANIRTLGATTTQTATYTDEEMRRLGIGKYANASTRARAQAAAYAANSSSPASMAAMSGNGLDFLSGNTTGGTQGGDVVVNLQTGPVLQGENGEKYVTLTDLQGALQDFASTVFGNARSTGGRRYAGVN